MSQLPGLSLEKHFGFLEIKALPKYREFDWQALLCFIWRMSAVSEGGHSSAKVKAWAKTNRGASGSQRDTGTHDDKRGRDPVSGAGT